MSIGFISGSALQDAETSSAWRSR